jgi:hypothetical protein
MSATTKLSTLYDLVVRHAEEHEDLEKASHLIVELMGSDPGPTLESTDALQRWMDDHAVEIAQAIKAGRDADEVKRLQRCILNAADAIVARDSIEAYHQLYGAVDPTYSMPGDPFERLRSSLPSPIPDDRAVHAQDDRAAASTDLQL